MGRSTRRQLLRGSGVGAVAAIAGCSGGDGGSDGGSDGASDGGDGSGAVGPGGPVTFSLSATSEHVEDGVAAGLDDLQTAAFDVGSIDLERADAETVTLEVGETLDLAAVEDLGYDDREFVVEDASIPAGSYGEVTMELTAADVTGPDGNDVSFGNVDPFAVTTFEEPFEDGDDIEILVEFRPFRREGADRWELSSSVGLYT